MNILTLIIACLALLFSLAALYFSFFIYRKHDRELQYQSDLIKKYDIDKTEEKIDDEDKAMNDAEVIDESKTQKSTSEKQ